MCEYCGTLAAIDHEVVKFLSDYGVLPALKEDVDPRIEELEAQLYNRLRRQQAGLESQFIAAIRELGYIPGNPEQQAAIIDAILAPTFEQMSQTIASLASGGAIVGRQLTFDDLVNLGMNITFTEFSQAVKDELENRIYTFSRSSFERISGDFSMTLTKGYMDGLGIDAIADNLRGDFAGLRDYRLKLISRTETQGAQNVGINQTCIDYGVEYKQWLTVGDSRVRGHDPDDRADHTKLHGEVVKMDEAFSNGLMHPLDRSGGRGTIQEWINCRCRMRPYIPRANEHIISTPYFPSRQPMTHPDNSGTRR